MAGAIIGSAITGKMASDSAKRNRPADAPKVDLNRLFSAGGSSLQGGRMNLDPSVGTANTNMLNRVDRMAAGGDFDFGQRFRGLGQEFAGNEGALINARMNPLRQQIAQQGGALERNLGRRGVQGTFANNAMAGFGLDAGRQLGDAQAMATQDALGARTNLLGAEQGAESALTQLLSGTNQNVLQNELAKLGLSVNSIQGLLGAQQQAASTNAAIGQNQANQQNAITGAMIGTIGQGINNYSSQPASIPYGYGTQVPRSVARSGDAYLPAYR